MRAITGIGAAAATGEVRARPVGRGAAGAAATGTALVAIAPAPPPERAWSPSRHPVAAFVAQLIATSRQAPQTRMRRRAEPAEALAVYAAASAVARQRGHAVMRSL